LLWGVQGGRNANFLLTLINQILRGNSSIGGDRKKDLSHSPFNFNVSLGRLIAVEKITGTPYLITFFGPVFLFRNLRLSIFSKFCTGVLGTHHLIIFFGPGFIILD